MTQFVSGWRSDIEHRTMLDQTAYEMALPAPKNAPAVIDPSNWLRVEDQMQQGSCEGVSISSCGELCFWIRTKGQIAQFSKQYSYVRAQEYDQLVGRDNGATIYGGVVAAKKYGFCLEELAPYTGKYYTKFSAEADADAATRKIQKHVKLNSYTDCFNFLASGIGGINFGIMLRQSFMNTPASGIVESMSGSVVGGHAMAVVGYLDKRDSQGRQYLWGPNSWGTKFGRNGWVLWSPSLFDRFCKDPQCEVYGISDMDVPEPRDFDWLKDYPPI